MGQVRVIESIDVHAEGEPARVLLGLHLSVRGATMAERLQWCIDHLDPVRHLLLHEPRGHPALCGVLVLPPATPDGDVGIVVVEQGGFRPMSGSNTMCAVTALLETGALPMTAPTTTVRIDTAVGRVDAVARVEGRKVVSVQVHNVPSFVVGLSVPVDVHGMALSRPTSLSADSSTFRLRPRPWALSSARPTHPRSSGPVWVCWRRSRAGDGAAPPVFAD